MAHRALITNLKASINEDVTVLEVRYRWQAVSTSGASMKGNATHSEPVASLTTMRDNITASIAAQITAAVQVDYPDAPTFDASHLIFFPSDLLTA